MADYAFFTMGVLALVAAVVVAVSCALITVLCIILACRKKRPCSGLIGFVLGVGSILTCGLTALPGLLFGVVGIRQKAYPKLSWAAVLVSCSVIFLSVVASISFFSEPSGWEQRIVPVSDASLAPYQAIFEVDREAMGFPPLPTSGTVKIEIVHRQMWDRSYPPPDYDVMLSFCDDPPGHRYTYRSVGLKKVGGNYQWIHEQLSFHGPKRYATVDGTYNEQITLTREKEEVAFVGTKLKGTSVTYSGPDARLAGNLTIAQVAPILREWGYKYDIENAQTTGSMGVESTP